VSVAKNSLKYRAYEEIKRKIIVGDVDGGSPLNEQLLVEELGISRTPIREALSMLQHEQLVEIYPKQGVFVSRISYKDVMDIYSLRILLESHAVQLATAKIQSNTLQEQYSLWEGLDENEDQVSHVAKDRSLHAAIVEATDNKYLIRYLEQLYDLANRIRHISLKRSSGRIRETHNEHLSIIRNMMGRDAQAAGKAMEQHLINARDTALQFFR
jgi:DNA-binding GntR family transcriptional regulator